MKQYYAYRAYVKNEPSYALLPVSKECVFSDGMYYPSQKVLLLLSSETKERFQIVPKLNDFGEVVKDKMNPNREKSERVRLSTSNEFYLSSIEDIKWFAKSFVENSEEFISFIESQNITPESNPSTSEENPVVDLEEKTA